MGSREGRKGGYICKRLLEALPAKSGPLTPCAHFIQRRWSAFAPVGLHTQQGLPASWLWRPCGPRPHLFYALQSIEKRKRGGGGERVEGGDDFRSMLSVGWLWSSFPCPRLESPSPTYPRSRETLGTEPPTHTLNNQNCARPARDPPPRRNDPVGPGLAGPFDRNAL